MRGRPARHVTKLIPAGPLENVIPLPYARPKTRADCEKGIRPCPYIGCRYNLLSNVDQYGNLELTCKEEDIPYQKDSCCLDIADEVEPVLQRDVEDLLHLSHWGIILIERRAMAKIKRATESIAKEC